MLSGHLSILSFSYQWIICASHGTIPLSQQQQFFSKLDSPGPDLTKRTINLKVNCAMIALNETRHL